VTDDVLRIDDRGVRVGARSETTGRTHLSSRKIAAEFLGTAFLLAAVVGSGIMAERLAGGIVALVLLCNTLATGAALVVLIAIFGPVSGAHFNPVVTLYAALRAELGASCACSYVAAQCAGAILGVVAAHAMFAAPLVEISHKLREGPSQWFSEFVATFGLIATIAGATRFKPASTASLVGLYIAAAYWFTGSTSFANPAVTLARTLTNSFAGIAPRSAPAFVAAQLAGALAGFFACAWLFAPPAQASHPASATEKITSNSAA